MAIKADDINTINVGELLAKKLRIPSYQRPYSWEPMMALQLVDDIVEAKEDKDGIPYVLGVIILNRSSKGLDVVDGQQRLLTLRMICAILDPLDNFSISGKNDNPVLIVWKSLNIRLNIISSHDDRKSLLTFIRSQCQVVQVVTEDIDEAFRVFDSQNYRGKSLVPHDLLKAHHLREMRCETSAMKSAVVETWESVRDEDLDRLFSIYLYRIARWSQGESAIDGFKMQDVGMFKGITPNDSLPPSSRYHLAAQASISMMRSWTAHSERDDRDSGRSRFQLDAPIIAGRCFFEMVEFMLRELKEITKAAFEGGFEKYAIYDLKETRDSEATLTEIPSRSRYRYVSELYLAAVLYYTNKFGDENLEEVRKLLFSWAYLLRIELLRVQLRSVDNRARGAERSSPFVMFRNSLSPRIIHQIQNESASPADEHESNLVAFLDELVHGSASS
ncbi:DUF262 domain-containing protein [Herbaspirillum huttiense]|uniref:DUF262 domain-containing protein n=1 Tax=Herbaspirillum huttiense TaxID=863372 RepID=UPI0010665162|nr:DUF262 domain-containing protein [Herbaspirillum huttiense]QBP74271.1 DUF262 domain-containing protein [Herbaspirillum huttiense]